MITLRNKTAKKLSEDICRRLTEVIDKISQRPSEDEVADYVWQLTFEPVGMAIIMGFPKEITPEEVLIIRNEIASQFRSIDKNWTYGNEQIFGKDYQDNPAYKELRKALKDAYALHEVVLRCEAYSTLDVEAISKTIACLRSTWETSHVKGFERLQFIEEGEQALLVSARKEIAAFYESLCSDKLKVYREAREAKNAAATTQTQKVAPAPAKKTEAIHTEKVVESTPNQVGLTSKEIITNEAQIKAFFEACDKMKTGTLGWLLENREKVEKLLEAYNQF